MESERIDWKAFAQQFRENHISQESFRELRYQNEMFNFYRILGDLDHENYWKRWAENGSKITVVLIKQAFYRQLPFTAPSRNRRS